jgi:glycosyltransferase involved in cell wall biosynthesis
MSRVSICLLTYNRAAVLPRSIDSLLAQTYGDFELIINDDCSTDETERVARTFVEADHRVKYFRNSTNLRYAGNQNAAIERARGDLVAIVHDGDVYRSDCFAQWVAALDAFPTVGIVFSASDALDENGNIICRYRHPYPPLIEGKRMIDEMLRLYSSPIFGIVMVRKARLLVAGRFSERFPILSDVDMWMRLLLVSDAAYINEPLFQIHPRESNHINRGVNWKIMDEHYQIFRKNTERRFSGHPRLVASVINDLHKKQRVKVLRAIIWCLRRAELRNAIKGISYLAKPPA